MPLTVLILHSLGDPTSWRTAVRDLEHLLPEHAPDHNYLVHPAERPLPSSVKELRFDAILIAPRRLPRHLLAAFDASP